VTTDAVTTARNSGRRLSAESVAQIEAALDDVAGPAAPGVASLVVLDRQIVHRSCRGLANLEYSVPITTATTFHVASMSKQFAAFALATVADRGLLDLDADIRDHLPYVPDLGVPITARQLAHHTSGLRDQWSMLQLSGWRMDDVISTDDVLGFVRRTRTLNFTPQNGFGYSNTGYTLMGELVRAVDGRTLREFCAQEIFEPLGMSDTHFHDDHREIVPGRAYSYARTATGGYQHAVLSYATVGATSLHTTALDLARWDQNFYDHTVGSDQVFGLMNDSGVLRDGTATGYAFGLMHDTYRGRPRVHHSGGDAGFRSHGARFPDLGLSVYVLSNAGDLDAVALTGRIADVVLDQLGIEPAAAAAGPIDEPGRYAGLYVDPDTGSPVELTVDDGTLKIFGIPLAEKEPNVLTAGSFTLRFPPGEGPAASLELRTTAMAPQRVQRVQRITPPLETLAEYAGAYWSDELEARYSVELVEDHLVISQRKLGTVALMPVVADRFSGIPQNWPLSAALAVAFDRDDEGRISGLRLSMPRTSNVRLERTGGADSDGHPRE
jgi:CubicO group peptidase (beta-lactamase class C family)